MNDLASSNIELRVLVLPTTLRDFELSRDILEKAGIHTVLCSSTVDLCAKMSDGVGAILMPEEAVPRDKDDDLARCIADQPSWSDLPLMILARSGANSERISGAMELLGNVTVLERPIRVVALVSAVRSALRARKRQYQVREHAKALESARDHLEARVRERTSEIREMNLRLQQKVRQTEAAEERGHQLLRELVTAQENERARIARDLHDELGQQLTSLRLHLSLIERELPKSSKARSALAVTVQEAEKIDSRVSFLAWMIRPTTLEELGLAKALRGYVREWSRNFDIGAEFSARDLTGPRPRLLPEIEVNVYRIAQECLNNVAKYANAESVSVLLTLDENELTLIVEDNGEGFDAAEVDRPSSEGGLGLRGMDERAHLLEGTFQIESTPSSGTTVYVRIPARFRPRTA